MIEVWNNCISDKEISSLLSAVSNRQIMEGAILKAFENKL